jgi:hypothetical protein
MEWIIALLDVTNMPLGMILWWIPRCDAIGVRKAKDRTTREPAPTTIAHEAAFSLSRRSYVGHSQVQEVALG